MTTNFKWDKPSRKQLKAARARLQAAIERAENKKVKARSEGYCELRVMVGGAPWRCPWPATQIHHMIGGWRLRGKGKSALAEHKQHVCKECHTAITGDINNKLVRVGGEEPHYTDWYRRA